MSQYPELPEPDSHCDKLLLEEIEKFRRDIPRVIRKQARVVVATILLAMGAGLLLQWWVLTS